MPDACATCASPQVKLQRFAGSSCLVGVIASTEKGTGSCKGANWDLVRQACSACLLYTLHKASAAALTWLQRLLDRQ